MNIRFFSFLSWFAILTCLSCNRQTDNSGKQIVNHYTNLENVANLNSLDKDPSKNLYDSLGRKQGLWLELDGLKETYYQDNLKHGIYKSYFATTGKLETFGEYQKSQRTGTWYYFDEKSLLYAIENDPDTKNSFQVKNDEGKFILWPYRSSLKLFSNLGYIQEEGIAIYDVSIQIDFYRYGKWKYYDQFGKLTHEENYTEGKLSD